MRGRVFIALGAVFLLQFAIFVLIYGSPAQKLQRSFTPTPSATPLPPPATPVRPTPIPTIIPVGAGAPTIQVRQDSFGTGQCAVRALDLIAAWVKAGKPEKDAFEFTSFAGKLCSGSFTSEILPLFTQPNIWYAGALACTVCHGPDVAMSAANLNLADYAGILAGARRAQGETPGQDILGDAGSWDKSRLVFMITTRQMPMGIPSNAPANGPMVNVGKVK